MDRTAKLWHLEYTHPLRVYAGHETDVDVVRFHPNGNYLATGGADKTVRLWSHADAKMVNFQIADLLRRNPLTATPPYIVNFYFIFFNQKYA
jgi:WD40 repeat protein